MNILLIEDEDAKAKNIASYLTSKGIHAANIIRAKNMTDFAGALHKDIDLFIIDFNLPSIDNGSINKNGRAILETIRKAGKQDALLLAISAHPDDFPALREFYESNGCILADYSNTSSWKATLDHLITQLKKNIRFDFLVFCALKEERDPYAILLKGKKVIRSGFEFFDVTIGGKTGSIVLMPQMGLVNAAITASVCIDRYKPTVVGMSGICGGFAARANMGQLFVSSMVYEYQSGKWAADGFKQEPYQVPTDHITLSKLKSLLAADDLISSLERGFKGGERPRTPYPPEVGIFTSGSAVIADSEYLKQVEIIHRKVNALDMEIYSIQRAAELSAHKPVCICAKAVVDLCGESKDDHLHSYGSYISAQFMIKAIQTVFA
jgi:nucleoside phosphorylase/CheY-like chemotaxis protein